MHVMDVDVLSLPALSELLIDGRQRLDTLEAEWMAWLAAFHNRSGYALEGHATCVTWLMHKCGMSRPTAKDRLRVALELQHRPVLAEAFAKGNVSYSKIRALTRIQGADDEADRCFLQAAQVG